MNKKRKYISNKLVKTTIVWRNKRIRKYVPPTCRLTFDNLRQMLLKFNMVYIKPVTGSLGIGVMRVVKDGEKYSYKKDTRLFRFSSYQKLYLSVRKCIGSRTYLVQKGIEMLKLEDRPFDFRVMIQRNPQKKWETTGTAARVAYPNKAVTNGSQGGTIYPALELLEKTAGKEKAESLLEEMAQIAKWTAGEFERSYPAMNELGLDIAVDNDLRPWIIEVNTRPDPCPFTKLPDSSAIDTIIDYAKSYGREYRMKCLKSKKAPEKPQERSEAAEAEAEAEAPVTSD
ncbi:YheC/YheD family protein [Paenibacillus tarimensis]